MTESKHTAETRDSEPQKPVQNIVDISGISKQFDDVTAVNNVNLSIIDGEFFSIIGPSGSGKTTLLRMIGGFENPTSGSVRINGTECTHMPPHNRDVNMIFQDLALFPHLNVKENVEYGLIESGIEQRERGERVENVLERVNLAGYQNRSVQQLSGGERQRVAVARGLVNEPSVLLLDEPLASLDEKLKKTMKIELKRIQDQTETTFVYVTHDQQVAMAMSDRIAVFKKGELQQVDAPENIYTNPANSFVADFTGAENIFDVDVIEMSNSSCKVKLGYKTFITSRSESVEAESDQHSRLIIRPEHIDLLGENGKISGKITELIYKGSVTTVGVMTNIGDREKIIQAEVHAEAAMQLDEGDTVHLDWSETNAMVVPVR